MTFFAKILISAGFLLIFLGIIVAFGARFFPGGMPGDIALRRGNTSFYFPIVSCIVLSLVGTVVLNLILRMLNR